MAPHPGLSDNPEVIVFNLKQRYTGVSATVNALVPLQMRQWALGYCGSTMSNGVVGMGLRQAVAASRQPLPNGRPFRIWHVRRDPEMMAGLWARDVLRLPVRLVFTSAAQHVHGAFPRWLISRMDAVIATTQKAADCVPTTTAVVHHGIDLARFAPVDKTHAWADSGLPGQFGIGVFGRVRPDKGTDVFVDALLAVLPRFPAFSAAIAGLAQPKDQAYQAELQARIDAAGLAQRLVFLGEVPAGEVARWYQRCLITVACPRYEPFGLTPFEAAATGCALVCSRTGAFEELVQPGDNGWLVPTGDAPALAEALARLMAQPGATQAMGERARQAVTQRFSLQAEADGIAAVYRGLWARGR